ncbi:MAG: MarR family winged helix-turn-helix transcriptional regulator [Kiritimatiellales bacterium]|nr:MarR family winged helix-turn-helix transcriptional regulator [Kiritimatiellales bacterium]
MKKSLLHILMHNGRLLQRAVEEELAPLGLHHGQGRILLAIASCDAITQADLARLMDIKPATVTNMLKPLEEKKLIHRETDPKTNRAVVVALTPAGKRACTEIQTAWDRIEKRMTEKLPDIETQKIDLFQALETIRDSLGGQPPENRKGF